MRLLYLQIERVLFHAFHHVAPCPRMDTPNTHSWGKSLLFFTFLVANVGEGEMRGIQLVAVFNLTARWNWILHSGPLTNWILVQACNYKHYPLAPQNRVKRGCGWHLAGHCHCHCLGFMKRQPDISKYFTLPVDFFSQILLRKLFFC